MRATAHDSTATSRDYRLAAENLVTVYTRDLMGNLLLFAVGGFALLLPFRFLSAVLNQRKATGAARPTSSFHRAFTFVFDVLALPGALCSSLFLSLAPMIVPGTSFSAIKGIVPVRIRGIMSRVIPLSVVAYALGFSFAYGGKGTTDRHGWIGLEHGRARLTALDLRSLTMLILAAAGFTALAVLMLTAYISLMQNGGTLR